MDVAEEFVVLLDEQGAAIGQQRKSAVHHARTPLHLAFSLYLFDDADRLLMTRRALSKATWPGVWTNSCCGHPAPGEPIQDAITRRLDTELGLQVAELQCVLPSFRYRTRDVSGVWENEICPVYVGRSVRSAGPVRGNPVEVGDWAWSDFGSVVAGMSSTPFAF